jgi:hypothetical protein
LSRRSTVGSPLRRLTPQVARVTRIAVALKRVVLLVVVGGRTRVAICPHLLDFNASVYESGGRMKKVVDLRKAVLGARR